MAEIEVKRSVREMSHSTGVGGTTVPKGVPGWALTAMGHISIKLHGPSTDVQVYTEEEVQVYTEDEPHKGQMLMKEGRWI